MMCCDLGLGMVFIFILGIPIAVLPPTFSPLRVLWSRRSGNHPMTSLLAVHTSNALVRVTAGVVSVNFSAFAVVLAHGAGGGGGSMFFFLPCRGFGLWAFLSGPKRRGPYGPTDCHSGEAWLRCTSLTRQPCGLRAGRTPPSAGVHMLLDIKAIQPAMRLSMLGAIPWCIARGGAGAVGADVVGLGQDEPPAGCLRVLDPCVALLTPPPPPMGECAEGTGRKVKSTLHLNAYIHTYIRTCIHSHSHSHNHLSCRLLVLPDTTSTQEVFAHACCVGPRAA